MLEVLGIAVLIIVVFFATMFLIASSFYVAGSSWTRGKIEALNAGVRFVQAPTPDEAPDVGPESENGG